MPVNDIWELRHCCHALGQLSVNVRHYRVTASTGGVAGPFVASIFTTRVSGPYKGLIHASANYIGTTAQKIWPGPVAAQAISTGGNGPGTAAGEPLPQQTCGLLSVKTNLAGPRHRGRLYIPFPAEGDNGPVGTPTAGYINRADGLAAVIDDLVVVNDTVQGTSETLEPVLWHRGNNTATLITAIISKVLWATQRRRGDFGRPNPRPF